MNFAEARENMVESQVRPNGITDRRITSAMSAVAREEFVEPAQRAVAYAGGELRMAGGRAMTEPMTLARLVQIAVVGEHDKVLHVGCGTGYGTAVLARLAAQVVALEYDTALAGRARELLASCANVKVEQGDLTAGNRAGAPFDAIVIEGRVGQVPQALFDQLADGGRLVAVSGPGIASKATLWSKSGGAISSREEFDAALGALPGFAVTKAAFVF